MAGKHLLDTNIIIALFKRDASVLRHLSGTTETFVPIISIGELFFGAQHSAHVQRNLQEAQAFAAQSLILNCDLLTAETYGQIKNELKVLGSPIPENDIWIAAIARQHGLIVVSRDQHFHKVHGLSLESW